MEEVSPTQANEEMSKGAVYLDVRTEEEFLEAHPAGAICIPFARVKDGSMIPNLTFVGEVQKLVSPGQRLLVGCKSGGRSRRAVEQLLAAGYTSIANVSGGFDGVRDPFGSVQLPGWRQLGLPVETGASP